MDRRLVERARDGETDAFAVLASEAVHRMYRVAYRICRDAETANDATQQALLEAWRDLPGLRDPERWEAWTYRLIVRACYREKQRARRSTGVSLLAVDAPVEDSAAAIADRDELERGFGTLSIEQRAVIVLHFYVGLPLTDVATTLDIPQGTARSRLHTALRRLRVALQTDAMSSRRGHLV